MDNDMNDAEHDQLDLIVAADAALKAASGDLEKPGGRAALVAALDSLDAVRGAVGVGPA